MQERKKYLVNILSYKYKQEQMKLFPTILTKNIISNVNKDLDIQSSNISSLCPGGRNCHNYIIICQLEKQIKMLNDTITQLKQINEFGDIKQNKLSLSELKFNESFKSEKSDKNSELCNSFRNSSIKRNNSLIEDKFNNQIHQTASCNLRTLSNDSEDKNNGDFNYIRNRIKCFNLNKEIINKNNNNHASTEKKFSEDTKIEAYKIFQPNLLKKKNLSYRYDQRDNNENDEKIIKGISHNNKVFFRNKIEDNSNEKKDEKESSSSSAAIKVMQNNLFGTNNNIFKEIKILRPNENDKNNKESKNNYFSGLKLKTLKTQFKFNLNNNNNEISSQQKIIQLNPNKCKTINNNKDSINKESKTINHEGSISNEFYNFIKDFENRSNYKNGELIYNQLYSLTLPKDKKILENYKSLSDENIYKYSSLINYSLKYISNITSFIQKIKFLINHNFASNTNILNYQQQYDNLCDKNNIKEEFYKFKEDCQTLLKCEKVNIYFYDINSDSLILKEENNEKKYQKDKDLIGLSFTSCKKIRHEPDIYNSNIFSTMALEQRLKTKIHNLLIFPIKDRETNVHGVIEVINKIKEENNNKSHFDKNDEILLDLLASNLGNFCKYFNYIEYKNKYINYYHYILHFWNKLFFKTSSSPSLYLVLEEFSKLMKKVFDSNEIQFLLYINQHLFDIQKNKTVELGGLINKCLQEKKIIYSSNPLKNKNYKINIDLPVIYNDKDNEIFNMEQLLTFPVFYGDSNENDISNTKSQNIIMIIQIKTKKKIYLGESNGKNNELIQENKFIIEYTSFLIQKYLTENKEIVNKFKYLI